MVHLKLATAVFFEISKGLVIIYVERGGREEKNMFGRSHFYNPFLPGHVNGK